MLLLLLAVPVGLAVGWLRGGSLLALRELPWRGGWFVAGAFLLRLAMALVPARLVPTAAGGWSLAGYLVTYGSLAAAATWNRRLSGVPLLGLGCLANLTVIVAAGGAMPYWTRAGRWVVGGSGNLPAQLGHVPVAHLSGLWYLSDVFPLPGPLASVFSPGDAAIAAGACWLVAWGMVRPRRLARTSATQG